VAIHKNRADYLGYVAAIPPESREEGMPRTPDAEQQCSKRVWETEMQRWREQLRELRIELGII
jgi:hypothetical protein